MLQVLEPLCEATKQLLEPVRLYPTDYLRLSMDADGEKNFIAKAEAWRPAEPWDKDAKNINGTMMVRASTPTSTAATIKWLKKVPERYEIKGSSNSWRLAATDFTAIVISHIWPREKIIFDDELTQLTFEYVLKRFESQAVTAKYVRDWKLEGKLPTMPVDYFDHPDLPLEPYQKVGFMTTFEQECSALYMEQGLGKTPIIVYRVNVEGKRKADGKYPNRPGKLYRALIICPQHVKKNWAKEFERFSIHPGKTSILNGGLVERQQAMLDGIRPEPGLCWSACIISQDSLESTWDALSKVPWDLVCYDESHGMKHSGGVRFRCARNFRNHTTARVELTGTPVGNTPFDLWPQLEFLGHGMSGFMTERNFRSFHGKFAEASENSPVQKLIGLKNIPLIQERLARLAFILRVEESGITLPDKVYDFYEVDMTSRQAKIYDDLGSRLAYEIEEGLKKETITVQHALTMLLRLAQVCSGHVKWDSNIDPITMIEAGGKVEQIDPGNNPKVQAVIDMLAERDPRAKTIIWACFIEDMRVISESLAAKGINHTGYHEAIHKDFRVQTTHDACAKINLDPTCKVFIGNPASAGTGLTIIGYDRENPDALDTYVDHEIFFSCNWSYIQRDQAEARAHRRGARMPVRITDLMISGTIDEEIRARVNAKKQTALDIQDIREILVRLK